MAADGADMTAVMFNIIVLMALGYVLNLMGPLQTPAQRGVLGMFITNLALPALFFQSLSQEDFQHTNLPLLGAVVLAKVCMLSSGWIFGRVARESSMPAAGSAELCAGMFGLLTTNGDEVGLGVPAMTALFPDMMPILYARPRGIEPRTSRRVLRRAPRSHRDDSASMPPRRFSPAFKRCASCRLPSSCWE